MSKCIVTTRFLELLKILKSKNIVKSDRQFALSLDFHPQCLNDISRGKRKVTIEILRKSSEMYQLNEGYLLHGQLPKFNNEGNSKSSSPIISVVVDSENNEKIVHVPIAAQAGYVDQMHDPQFFKDLHSFTIPGYEHRLGTYRSFDISGESMEPLLYNGESVVCKFVEPDFWKTEIRDQFVYVIVTESDIVVKRVINKLNSEGLIECFSDNSFYEMYQIEAEQIREIWKVATKISPFMQSPKNIRNGIHKEIDILKEVIKNQDSSIKNLNATIEQLLKANRSVRA